MFISNENDLFIGQDVNKQDGMQSIIFTQEIKNLIDDCINENKDDNAHVKVTYLDIGMNVEIDHTMQNEFSHDDNGEFLKTDMSIVVSNFGFHRVYDSVKNIYESCELYSVSFEYLMNGHPFASFKYCQSKNFISEDDEMFYPKDIISIHNELNTNFVDVPIDTI